MVVPPSDNDGAVLDDSAIEEESDWEDTNEKSDGSSAGSRFTFKRTPITKYRGFCESPITRALQKDAQPQQNARIASESTPALPSSGTSRHGPVNSRNTSDEMKSHVHPRVPPGTVLDPRTTRREMLKRELMEWIREMLLQDRSLWNQISTIALKHRSTGPKRQPGKTSNGEDVIAMLRAIDERPW